jgi:hypothetical protein
MWNIPTIWVAQQMMQDVHGNFNPGLPEQNRHSTGRRLFSPTKGA